MNTWDRIKNLFSRNKNNNSPDISSSQSSIKLEDKTLLDKYFTENKGKGIMSGELSQQEIDKRSLNPQLTGLRDITGENFRVETGSVLNEIDTFVNYHERSKFPKAAISVGIYKLLKERLLKLSETNKDLYNQLTQNNEIKDKIDNFLDLDLDLENKTFNTDNQSETYNEVAQETIREQDI